MRRPHFEITDHREGDTAYVHTRVELYYRSYGVHLYVAVLKAANFLSMGLLRHLGFEPATQVDAVRFEAEHDETVMLKGAPVRHVTSPNTRRLTSNVEITK